MARKKVQPEQQLDTAMDAALETTESVTPEENQGELLPGESQPVLMLPGDEQPGEDETADEPKDPEPVPEPEAKPKRRRAAKSEPEPQPSEPEPENTEPTPDESENDEAPKRRVRRGILTIEAGDVIESPEEQDEIAWHEIQNAYRSKRILTGTLGGVERTGQMSSVNHLL